MSKIASELLVERLIDWDVEVVFGLPGDGINGIMEGFRRHDDRIRFVLVHHEEAAAFMASGYAKTTGRLGVCLATSGPGAIHLLNGLYDAKLDHAPVLAITGTQSTDVLGTGYQQEVHLEHLFADVASYNIVATLPASIPSLVDFAVRNALSTRSVSHLSFPVDLQEAAPDARLSSGGLGTARTPSTAPIYRDSPRVPRSVDLVGAADALNRGERVAVLAGAGARGARTEVLHIADLLAAPIIKTLSGKDAVPDDHPLTTGGLGLLGTTPSEAVMEQCDTLLMIGTNYPYTSYLPSNPVETVQIDHDGTRIGGRIPTQHPLVGDTTETLRALTPRIERHGDRTFLSSAQEQMDEWRRQLTTLEDASREPIHPQYLMATIDRAADDDAILCADSGANTTWSARHWTIREDRQYYLSGNLASMAPGLPYAIANQIAHPGRQCIAFVGDGAFAMLMAEFLTACRYGLPIKVFVCNNALLAQILWEQMVLGYPEFGVRWNRAADFAPWAQSCGGLGIHVEKPGDVESAVRDALSHPGPALVDCVVNADEPPMPARIRYDQAKGFAEAFFKGQYHRSGILSTVARDKINQLKPW
jgi:pyruvate dehydrogenase (quinone)